MVYFAYNAQGDVIGLYGDNGTLYATYDYDAWGNCTVTPLVADTAGHSITCLLYTSPGWPWMD